MRAVRLLREAVKLPGEVIDCAVGQGLHSMGFISKGKRVVGIDLGGPKISHPLYTHIRSPFELAVPEPSDILWSCHTLEHVTNPGFMLEKFRSWLNPGGWLAISVPSSQQNRLHVGHLTLWTPAHLMYNLVVNGWNCKEAKWYTEYCSVALLVQKTDDIDFSGRTAMPSEVAWLNQYMPREVMHEGDSWWPNRWHEETEPRVFDPPKVTYEALQATVRERGERVSGKPKVVRLAREQERDRPEKQLGDLRPS